MINAKWHKANKLTKSVKGHARIQWHVDHARECGCRPIPDPIKAQLAQRKPKLVASVLVQNNNKYLLVKERLEGGKDMWIIPGGKVEFGESLEAAARREILEETGIETQVIDYLCFKEALFPDYNYHTVIFFYKATTTQEKLGTDIEGKVKEANWFTLDEALTLPLVESAKWLFDELHHKT